MDRSARAAFIGIAVAVTLGASRAPLWAQQRNGSIYTQCPGDANGDAIPDPTIRVGSRTLPNPNYRPNVQCMHLAAGDGFVTMADGKQLYTFGFSDVTGLLPSEVVNGNGSRIGGLAAATYPAPTIHLKEGQEFYLSLTNVGMIMRPDLFDPHSVHFHGFPQAAAIFDGVPESSATINMGSTFTYYYRIPVGLAGTYMYHCHVEATEHIQMGMVGNLYIDPAQDGTPFSYAGRTFTKFAYNDGDGSTGFDLEYPIQLGSFDGNFHDQHIAIQPLPFAAMDDKYSTLNGRGYPDTIDDRASSGYTNVGFGDPVRGVRSQPYHSKIVARSGQRVLLRLSSLSTTRFYTIASTIPMLVVGQSAKLLRGPSPDGSNPGQNLYYRTNSLTLGGGESYDVILDTAGVAAGTYLLYTTNLNYLSNDRQDYGGMMTEISVTSAGI
jgi:FtsP/CotA-like multicopper oxidase with cupredoxin domain